MGDRIEIRVELGGDEVAKWSVQQLASEPSRTSLMINSSVRDVWIAGLDAPVVRDIYDVSTDVPYLGSATLSLRVGSDAPGVTDALITHDAAELARCVVAAVDLALDGLASRATMLQLSVERDRRSAVSS